MEVNSSTSEQYHSFYKNILQKDYDQMFAEEWLKTQNNFMKLVWGDYIMPPFCTVSFLLSCIGCLLTIVTIVKEKESFNSFFYKLLIFDSVFNMISCSGALMAALLSGYSTIIGGRTCFSAPQFTFFLNISAKDFNVSHVELHRYVICTHIVPFIMKAYWQIPVWVFPDLNLIIMCFMCVDRMYALYRTMDYKSRNEKYLHWKALGFVCVYAPVMYFPWFAFTKIWIQTVKGKQLYVTRDLSDWQPNIFYEKYVHIWYLPLKSAAQIILVIVCNIACGLKLKKQLQFGPENQVKEDLKRTKNSWLLLLVTSLLTAIHQLFELAWQILYTYRRVFYHRYLYDPEATLDQIAANQKMFAIMSVLTLKHSLSE